MADKRKTGIFGGAFNPVHNGHIALARSCFRECSLDRMIFIPTAKPPHKSDVDFACELDRLNMLSLALEDFENVEISDIEFKREEKSYTFDTLTLLREKYPDDEFYLIIGADQFLSFNRWYKYREILEMVTLFTAARENEEEREKMKDFATSLDGLKSDRFVLSLSDVVNVSSSEIRHNIENNLDAASLLPKKVYNYIVQKGLYGYNGI